MPPRGDHEPVLLGEVLAHLAPAPGRTVVDATVGAGGHAVALAERVGPAGRLIGIDRDPAALELAARALARFGERVLLLRGDHSDLERLLDDARIEQIDAVLFDLGVSSMQLDSAGRGFSFRHDGPLDMRMDPDAATTAADLVNALPEEELRRLVLRFGEERRARAVARAIVRRRAERPFTRTLELAEVVRGALGPAARRFRIDPATRTFQALRIAVNAELDSLGPTLDAAVARLAPGGRVALISFHSLEDRTVKHALRALAERCVCPPDLPRCGCGRLPLVRVVTPRPVRPTPAELARNPRSRSARLRVAERLP